MPSSGIQDGGSQPQPGFRTPSPASSDCRETQNGSTARSSFGPISASDSGAGLAGDVEAGARAATGSRLRRPAAHRLRPRSMSRPSASPARPRIDGSFAPGVRLRPAMRCRIAAMTIADARAACVALLRSSVLHPCTITVWPNCTGLSLATPAAAVDKADAIEGVRMDRTASGWINGFIGVVIFSGSLPATRVAVHAVRSGLPDRRARRHRRRAGARPAAGLPGEAAGARRHRLARDRRARRRRRLSAADGAGAAARHLGAFDRLHRPAAAVDGDLRRAARRRAAEAGVLDLLGARQRAGGRLRPDAGARPPRRSAMR